MELQNPFGKAPAKWTTYDESLLVLNNFCHKSKGPFDLHKLAIFDLDDTIITTTTGKAFAANCNDWKFLYPAVPVKLKALY